MKRIVKRTMACLLILAIVVFSFRLYMISSKEVVDTTQFTDYFQLDEADNGGLELTTSNFTTFEKEYNFVKEEKVEEDKKRGKKRNLHLHHLQRELNKLHIKLKRKIQYQLLLKGMVLNKILF